ncbi:hypothetical protein IW261DRAFT_1557493 [Armillaria novae-zelandiae]|uniref:CNH-domain-containing protein n=1 Tax=Armillaria novae-zelandiae TaxID=153914 RepID=A0AA39PR47_9AGAR|nr:hypothetical protein IW261DRAFT_1557493 [Armillaria novae-zelandiae]
MDGAPDKRHAAYQSIFGRPTHHQPPPPPQYYPQYQDRRTSYVSYQQPPPPLPNAQYIYRQPPPMQYGYPYTPSGSSLAPPTGITRARSVASNPNGMGVIVPLPEEPPDPNLDVLTRSGLTPAQAYQAQVYLNGPQRYQPPPMPQSRTPDPPRLGIPVDSSRLNVDFSNLSDAGTDDSSELPWARKGPTPSPPIPPHHHSRFSHGSSESPFPLHVDTHSAQSIRSSVTSASPSSFTMVEHPPTEESTLSTVTARRSSESTHIPRVVGPRRERAPQDRSMSMSAATTPVRNSVTRPPVPAHKEGRDSPVSIRIPKKSPIVYPALLSRVAEAFRDRINLGDRIKDGLEYKEAFDGREAVDKIAYIIKTTDRNLALLLGRALDAQKFFHDVTYDHRLRDSPSELYRFRTKLPSPFVSGELGIQNNEPILPKILTEDENDSSPSPSTSIPLPRPRKGSMTSDEVELPSGVFTLLTDCYSPTCSRDQLCYSIACPRRLEQQARLNMKPQPGLSKQISRESLGDLPDAGTLWIPFKKKRQEAINEVIYTERDFVRDMEYLRDIWIKRLQEQDDVIPAERRTAFLEQVFWNVFDIIAVNTRLRDALNKRQKSYAVVEKIGDILLEAVPHFGPFVSYGAHQLYGKYEFEKEKNANAAFAQFVETTERLPESRKLELNAYLTKPTTRLARYPLLLEAVLKHTPEDNPDKTLLPEAISLVREFLGRVNTESGKTENRFNLIQLDQALVFKPGEEVNLRLREEGRDMVYKGPLNKRDGEIQVYLFDHALLFTKSVKTKQHEQVKVYRRPIPLELLLITASEDSNTGNGTVRPRQRQGLVKKTSFNRDSRGPPHAPSITVRPPEGAKGQYWINFIHLGRKFYNLVLWSNSQLGQRKWLENIYQQQQAMRERSTIFETVTLCEGFFTGVNKVNCVAPLSGGRRMAYGTDDGIYISDLRDMSKDPVKVLALVEVMQIDVLEAYQLLIILSERSVFTVPLDALDPMDPNCWNFTYRSSLPSIHYLKTKMCVGCPKGFEIVDLETLDTQGLLDPSDESLEFVRRREGLKPMAIYRIQNEFLLCYDGTEFAFYVNKSGRMSRKDFMVHWEGVPTGFALHEPFVLAFEPSFVEIRHIDTGAMSQVIQGSNLRLLFADNPTIRH